MAGTANDAQADEARRKPWREIGSIVLGVLIALLIGEIADALRWRVRVHTSMTTIRPELSGNRFNLVERRLVQPCIDRRLAAIGAILETARRTRQLPAVGSIASPPARPIERSAFDVALGEGVMLHMDRGTARDVALAYLTTSDSYGSETSAESAAWADLRLIEGAGGPIDDDTLLALRQALNTARWRGESVRATIDRAWGRLDALEIPTEFGPYRDHAGLVAFWRDQPLCRGIGADDG